VCEKHVASHAFLVTAGLLLFQSEHLNIFTSVVRH